MNTPRTRIAPSPTGKLHIGTARTALFNYLFTKKNNGKFVLRMEDTDRERSTKESENNILSGLNWLGICWDEGISASKNEEYGCHGPYRQTERLNIYQEYAEKLMQNNKTYFCYCTPEELEIERQELSKKKLAPKYSGKCRELTKETISCYEKEGRKKVLRLKLDSKIVEFNDLIKGLISIDLSNYGDPVILKSDGMPLYNFAVVIDDITMHISHIIRGEDHISNTPIQIQIYEALGEKTPLFGHIPLTLTPDKKKLSKRYGAVSIDEYKEKGYLKEAIINFLALLGWSSGTEKEIYSISELIEDFSIERMQKSNAIFDIDRLNWLNSVWIRKIEPSDLLKRSIPFFKEAGYLPNIHKEDYLEKIIFVVKDRLKYLTEIKELTGYFFNEKELDNNKLVFKKSTIEDTKKGLSKTIEALRNKGEWPESIDSFNEILLEVVTSNNLKNGDVFWPTRYALSFSEFSPSPGELLWVLPKDTIFTRLQNALEQLK
jgi:nondiscriminating glutamyl-tRNA synthetase